MSSSLSVESGFSRKSSAPRRVARTAISILAWPEIITTGTGAPSALMSSSSARPSLPGITTSEKIMSKGCAADQLERARGVVAHRGLVAGQPEGARQRGQRVGFVVDDQQVGQIASVQYAGMRLHYRWAVVLMLWSICFFNYADRQAIFSVFPLLEKEMHLGPVELGLLGSAFAWIYGLGAPMAGLVVDRVRRKSAILGGPARVERHLRRHRAFAQLPPPADLPRRGRTRARRSTTRRRCR